MRVFWSNCTLRRRFTNQDRQRFGFQWLGSGYTPQDDPGTVLENSGGTVTTIRIFDQAYTPDNLPTPEPATLSLLAGGILAIWLRRR